VYVKSNTVVGDSKHTTGVVMAEIVMANIPVKNGVVHLIHRPLMVVDTTVAKFLEVSFQLPCNVDDSLKSKKFQPMTKRKILRYDDKYKNMGNFGVFSLRCWVLSIIFIDKKCEKEESLQSQELFFLHLKFDVINFLKKEIHKTVVYGMEI
jgi:hypothetical protein